MYTRRLLTVLCTSCVFLLSAQDVDILNYRTIDGTHNNLSNLEWGATETPLRQFTSLGFTDGFSSIGGTERPNPRVVSNNLFEQEDLFNDPAGLSDFTWVWGQFLDHDIGLTSDGPEPLIIQVPAGDIHFDPFGVGMAIIPMHRNAFDPNSGTDATNPRRYLNEITAFIDGSGVYGSDSERADWLRSFEDGKLKVSAGNLMPYNTLSGELEDEIDPDAPDMANEMGLSDKVFVAGDVRANENPLLATIHTLFVREHNRQCERLQVSYPDWTDEELYQYARKLVSGKIQSIVYDEWLPAMGVELLSYQGYDATMNPQLMNIFSGAAFRLGHTLLNGNIMRLDAEGNTIPQGDMTLRDAFFNPLAIQASGGIDPFLKGMAVQVQQSFDAKVIDDVRNFLFGQPGFGGLDLASININRGRERGLPDFNTVRADFGLSSYNFFQQINPDAAVFTRLLSTYVDINDIDPWVGMLAERPLPGSIFGSTVQEIMIRQFTSLRDGDRFYYWNDPVLSLEEKENIQNTTFRDIIMYNTGINLMQDNVFGALPHVDICENMTLDLSGLVRTTNGLPVNNVSVELTSTTGLTSQLTSVSGQYGFSEMPFCELDLLLPTRNDDPLNGVSTFDIILISKHILGVEPLTDPYQMIAADVNGNGSISTIDLIRLRKLILAIDSDFGDNTSWRFVLGAYTFEEGVNPLATDFPEWLDFQSEQAANYNSGFIAVKVGDVNGSADPGDVNGTVEDRYLATGLNLDYTDQYLAAGEETDLLLRFSSEAELLGWQFELQTEEVDIIGVQGDWAADFYTYVPQQFRMSYDQVAAERVQGQLQLRLRAKKELQLSEELRFGSNLSAQAYTKEEETLAISLQAKENSSELWVGQNVPNPFTQQTTIPFSLNEATKVTRQLIDQQGRVVFEQTANYLAGDHEWLVEARELNSKGWYTYRIKTAAAAETKVFFVH